MLNCGMLDYVYLPPEDYNLLLALDPVYSAS